MRVRLNRGWDAFLRFLDPRRTRERLQTEVHRKVLREMHLLRRDVLSYVAEQRHGIPNSPLTVLWKGSSLPLVDRGDLRQGIHAEAWKLKYSVKGAVGVLRTARSKSGKQLWNVARALHEGFDVKVTPAVRAAVFAQIRKRTGKSVRVPPGGGGAASVWHVRGRPFLRVPLEEALPRIRLALGDAVKTTLKRS